MSKKSTNGIWFARSKINQRNRFVECYKITRSDPTIFHNGNIDYWEYEPDHQFTKHAKSESYFFKTFEKYELFNKGTKDTELELEFTNRHSIAAAADHLKLTRGKSKSSIRFKFDIKKIITKATLKQGKNNLTGIIYEYSDGKPIDFNGYETINKKINTSFDFLIFAKYFATAIQKLHNQSVVHSYLVPRNLLCSPIPVAKNGTLPIDIVGFGYARLGSSAGRRKNYIPDKSDFPDEDQLYLAPECKSLNPFGDFWFPADIYSIGAILYSLLCNYLNKEADNQEETDDTSEEFNNSSEKINNKISKNIQEILKTPPRDPLRLKKLIHKNLTYSAKKIIEGNENIVKIIDHCLRHKPEHRFSCIEELLESIDIAMDADPKKREDKKPPKTELITPFKELIRNFSTKKTSLSKSILHPIEGDDNDYSSNKFFTHMVDELVEDAMHDSSKMRRGHLEVYGNRDKIVTSLCRMLCAAGKGYQYNTMTIPHYWLDTNLGSIGRFLIMNKHKARNGVKIQRIFLVDEEYFLLLDADEQAMLLEHMDAQGEIEKYLKKTKPDKGGSFEVKIQVVQNSTINSFELKGKPVAHLLDPSYDSPASGKTVLANQLILNFYSSTSTHWFYGKQYVSRVITKVRFWAPKIDSNPNFAETITDFQKEWKRSIPLREYIQKVYAETGDSKRREPKDIKLDEILGIR